MENIRTSISDCVNRAKYRELPAKTSNVIGISDYVSDNVHKALKDKVGLSMIFLIESGFDVRYEIENKLINKQMITVRGKICDGINDFIRGMHKLKIDDYIEIDVYTNVVETTIHGVSGILWISISTQVENNLKNKQMRNVKINIFDKINIFRFYKYRPRIDGYVMQNLIANITDPFIGVSVIARISIADQVEDNIKNNQMKNIRDKININFVRDDVVEITWNPTAYHLDPNKGEKIFHKTIMAVDEVILRVCLKVIGNLKNKQMRNVNAKIGYIVNNIRWDKYDPKTINSVGPDLYDIVVESALLGVRRTLFKASIRDQMDNNLNWNNEEYQNKYW